MLLQGRSVPRILISYRRRDSAAITGRLYDRLVQRYGASSLFLDIDNIPYGPDFRQHVRDALSQTDLVLLVIGPDWVGRRTGRLPRIADDSDPVRIEIETTLQAKIHSFQYSSTEPRRQMRESYPHRCMTYLS